MCRARRIVTALTIARQTVAGDEPEGRGYAGGFGYSGGFLPPELPPGRQKLISGLERGLAL
jgi:hypothetical protein